MQPNVLEQSTYRPHKQRHAISQNFFSAVA